MKKTRLQIGVLAVVLALLGLVLYHQQAIADWEKLHDYTPPAAVSQLAVDDTMTDKAKHLFYVNHPSITTGTTFTSNCPAGGEKTIVLGCYVGDDKGVYVYKVSDSRLNGVEQVTAAHEMLHAAYRRLSTGERTKVNNMLTDYYEHHLTNQRLKDVIDAYKQSEPHDVVNEMHSVFGTEVANLPGGLEEYYKQYFTDRAKVTGYATAYESEFTTRQNQVVQDDAQLKQLKTQIDADQTQLTRQKAAIDAQSHTMNDEEANGQVAAYNSQVAGYNQAVSMYRSLASVVNSLIDQYNGIVDARNVIALQAERLSSELSATAAN